MILNAIIRAENRPTERIVDGQRAIKRWLELSQLLDYRHTYCTLSVAVDGDEYELLSSAYNENVQQAEATARYQNGSIKEEFYLDDFDDSDDILEMLFE